jgi:hypothetical protein
MLSNGEASALRACSIKHVAFDQLSSQVGDLIQQLLRLH